MHKLLHWCQEFTVQPEKAFANHVVILGPGQCIQHVVSDSLGFEKGIVATTQQALTLKRKH